MGISIYANSQNSPYLHYKVGLGASLSGSGDIIFYEVNNGLNIKLNDFLTSGLNLTYGSVVATVFNPPGSLLKADINIMISPFTNTKKFDIRLGGGVSYYKSFKSMNGEIQEIIYETEVINTVGFNTIVEFVLEINKRNKISLQAHISPYGTNVDINSGITLSLYRQINQR